MTLDATMPQPNTETPAVDLSGIFIYQGSQRTLHGITVRDVRPCDCWSGKCKDRLRGTVRVELYHHSVMRHLSPESLRPMTTADLAPGSAGRHP